MLDISYLSDNEGHDATFLIMDKEMHLFQDAFITLKQKTGIYIDPYGSTRIYPEHQEILVQHFYAAQHDKIRAFIAFLHVAIQKKEVLIADGD